MPSFTTLLCHVAHCYMFRFAETIIRQFLLQKFGNVGTFERAVLQNNCTLKCARVFKL